MVVRADERFCKKGDVYLGLQEHSPAASEINCSYVYPVQLFWSNTTGLSSLWPRELRLPGFRDQCRRYRTLSVFTLAASRHVVGPADLNTHKLCYRTDKYSSLFQLHKILICCLHIMSRMLSHLDYHWIMLIFLQVTLLPWTTASPAFVLLKPGDANCDTVKTINPATGFTLSPGLRFSLGRRMLSHGQWLAKARVVHLPERRIRLRRHHSQWRAKSSVLPLPIRRVSLKRKRRGLLVKDWALIDIFA